MYNPFKSSRDSTERAPRTRSNPPKPRSSRPPPPATPPPPPPQQSASHEDLPSATSPRTARLEQLVDIDKQLMNLQRSFAFPSHVSFLPHATPEKPLLAFTPAEKPVHAQEEALLKLLIKLDGIESEGDPVVREQRKKLVNRVDAELASVDEQKKRAFEQSQSGGGGAAVEDEIARRKAKVDELLQARDGFAPQQAATEPDPFSVESRSRNNHPPHGGLSPQAQEYIPSVSTSRPREYSSSPEPQRGSKLRKPSHTTTAAQPSPVGRAPPPPIPDATYLPSQPERAARRPQETPWMTSLPSRFDKTPKM